MTSFGTSHTKNENDMDLFSMITVMDYQGRAGKSYMVDLTLTTLVNKENLNQDYSLKLATTGEVACFVERYTVYSNDFGVGISTDNKKLNKLTSNKLKDEQERSQNFKIIFID